MALHALPAPSCASPQTRLSDRRGRGSGIRTPSPHIPTCRRRSRTIDVRDADGVRGRKRTLRCCLGGEPPETGVTGRFPRPPPPRKRGSPASLRPGPAALEPTWFLGCLLLSHKQEGRKRGPFGQPFFGQLLRDPLSSSPSSPSPRQMSPGKGSVSFRMLPPPQAFVPRPSRLLMPPPGWEFQA